MIYAVGDIHGRHERLKNMLELLPTVGMTDEDTLVFVGDYVDRGLDSAGVLQTLIDLKARRPKTVFLRGNHEQMMLDARQHYDPSFDANNPAGNCEAGVFWFAEGGTETLRSYEKPGLRRWHEVVPDEHWQFMLDARLEYDEGNYHFVHAGVVPPGVRWVFPPFAADPRLWIREEFHISQSDFDGKVIVFGHTPTADSRPIILWNKIGIDTGAGYGGPLTAVALPTVYNVKDVQVFQT